MQNKKKSKPKEKKCVNFERLTKTDGGAGESELDKLIFFYNNNKDNRW